MKRAYALLVFGVLGLGIALALSSPALSDLGPCAQYNSGNCWCYSYEGMFYYCEGYRRYKYVCGGTFGACTAEWKACHSCLSTPIVVCAALCDSDCVVDDPPCQLSDWDCR